MIIRLVSLFFVLLTAACGQGGAPYTATSDNLFLQVANESVDDNVNSSLLGLWESEEYELLGVTYQIRWEITSSHTKIAKQCKTAEGKTYQAQITIPLNQQEMQQSENLSPYNLPLQSQSKVTDVVLMTGNRDCRISASPSRMNDQSLIASDANEFTILDGDYSSGEMELETLGDPSTVKLKKVQNRD